MSCHAHARHSDTWLVSLLVGDQQTAWDTIFHIFCTDSWSSVLGHILFLIIWFFGTNFSVADSRPALEGGVPIQTPGGTLAQLADTLVDELFLSMSSPFSSRLKTFLDNSELSRVG